MGVKVSPFLDGVVTPKIKGPKDWDALLPQAANMGIANGPGEQGAN